MSTRNIDPELVATWPSYHAPTGDLKYFAHAVQSTSRWYLIAACTMEGVWYCLRWHGSSLREPNPAGRWEYLQTITRATAVGSEWIAAWLAAVEATEAYAERYLCEAEALCSSPSEVARMLRFGVSVAERDEAIAGIRRARRLHSFLRAIGE